MTGTVSTETTENEMLPQSWEWAAYSELGEWSGGGTPRKSNSSYWEEGSIPWFSPKDMRGLELHDSQDHITESALQESAAKPIRAGSLLFVVRSGILRRTLPVALTTIDGAVNQDIKALTPSKLLSAKYLLYATVAQKEEIRYTCKKAGTTVESIQVASLQTYRLPIPPLNEQRRIVEKIEELFTRLDAGVRSLKQTQALLKSYRRSVLKAAVEGELSREWREAHQDELEPASELLERILQERREKFTGKKYKEPASPDTSNLPKLPDRWEWATVDYLASAELHSLTDGPFGSNLKTAHYTNSGPRVVRLQNIAPHKFVDEEAHISEEHYEGLTKHAVHPGDLVIRALGEPAPVACMIPSSLGKAIVKADCIKFKPAGHYVNATYVMYALNSAPVQKCTTAIIHGIGRPRLNMTEIRRIAVPLPPIVEQNEIAKEIDRRLSVVDKLEATVEANLKQADALRQSILKQAFCGELVAQDPEDEPASVLLERIRSERQAAGKKSKKREAKWDGAQGRLI